MTITTPTIVDDDPDYEPEPLTADDFIRNLEYQESLAWS